MPAGGDVCVQDLGVYVERFDASPGGVVWTETFGCWGSWVGDAGDGGVDGQV